MFESITKEVIRDALSKAVEDVGMEVAIKALTNTAPLSDAERELAVNE